MDSDTAALIAIAASVAVPMIILLFQQGQAGRSSFVTEARLLLDAQTARAEQAEHARDHPHTPSDERLAALETAVADHIAASDKVHANLYEDMSELGTEVDVLRRMLRDVFNKRGGEVTP